MTEGTRAFRLRLDGDRFSGKKLPVDVMPELQRFEHMVVEVAAQMWKEENPERNLPRGFRDEFKLAMTAIEDGSAVPVLEAETTSQYSTYFDNAATEIEDAFASLVAREFPDLNPRLTQSKAFQEFGSSLHDGEAIEFRPNTPRAVRYTPEIRTERLQALVAPVVAPSPVAMVMAGRLTALDADRQTFAIKDLRHREIKGRYENPEQTDNLRAVLQSSTLAPVIRVTGNFLSDADGRPRRIIDVAEVELFGTDRERWTRRLVELATLDPGWNAGSGQAIEFPALDAAREIMRSVDDLRAGDVPGIFPLEGGGVQLEWASAQLIVSVEITEDLGFSLFRLEPVDRTTSDLDTEVLSEAVTFLREALS